MTDLLTQIHNATKDDPYAAIFIAAQKAFDRRPVLGVSETHVNYEKWEDDHLKAVGEARKILSHHPAWPVVEAIEAGLILRNHCIESLLKDSKAAANV